MSRGRAALAFGGPALILAGTALAVNDDRAFMVGDPLIGAAAAWLIVRGARRRTPGIAAPRWSVFRVLEDRRAVALGTISYSLYLIHHPLLAIADVTLAFHGGGPDVRLSALLLVVSPLCIPAAILFHRLFERSLPSKMAKRTGMLERIADGPHIECSYLGATGSASADR